MSYLGSIPVRHSYLFAIREVSRRSGSVDGALCTGSGQAVTRIETTRHLSNMGIGIGSLIRVANSRINSPLRLFGIGHLIVLSGMK